MTLDAVVTCIITVHWGNEAEQAAVRTISMAMATCFDEIARTDIVAPYTVGKNTGRGRPFERPGRYSPTVVRDVEVDDRVWCDKDNLPHCAFDLDPILDIVVRVRVMGARELRYSDNG
jgi:hypothetical protein